MIHKKIQSVSLMLCLFILSILAPLTVSAKENPDNTVRIGIFEETYNTVNEKGERSGYGYEYLRNIAGYSGWTYEYVTSSWADCFAQLENGEIDILGGISYTDERAENMLFSDLPMGEEKYYIYADASNTNLSAADIYSFDGKNIGVLKDHIPEDVLNEWEKKYGLHLQHVDISSTEEILEKLKNQEIDCFVSLEESRWDEVSISPVTYIGNSDIYFVINKNRPDIKNTLDIAMRRIRDDNPFYADDLYKRYLSAQSSAFLSREEKEWLKQHGAIKIGYLNNDTGVSALNPTTGELSGVIKDYVNLAENCLQGQTLQFELKGYDTRTEQLEALHNGEIDLIFHVSQNPYSAEKNGFVLSDTVWTFNMAAITAKNSFDESADNVIAVAKDNFAMKAYISYNYPRWTIEEYETQQEAVKAVKKEQADCFVCNSAAAAEYIRKHNLQSIFLTKSANASFAIQQGEPLLLSIMNKTLMSMPTDKFSGAVVSYNSAMNKVTITDFIRDNFFAVAIVGTAVFAGILLVILGFLRKSMRAEAEAKKFAEQEIELNHELEKNKEELQVALVEAQKANKAKTTFLNNMSHDIRTPINGIVGLLEIIQKSEDDPERVKDSLGKINKSANLLLSLINDVLDMAKMESGAVVLNNESISLEQVCSEITENVTFQAEAQGLHITGEHDDYSGIYVWSSAIHLKKILMNLFTNCMKYNKPNGSIDMSMRTIDRSEEYITCEFKIKDTGVGMTEEFIKNELFTPFVQADNSARSNYIGTGLGMPIVKQLVEKMGGTITVESKLGEGSSFTVVLPFKIDTEAKPEKTEENPDADISGLRILLVEDNELNMEIAEFMLNDCKAIVEKAVNGLEAVEKFEASEAGTYDVILMDIMMPVMDGLTATKSIRALDREDAKTIPIIAMTANAFKEDADKCLQAGMNAHLAKPLDIQKVIMTIVRCCRHL